MRQTNLTEKRAKEIKYLQEHSGVDIKLDPTGKSLSSRLWRWFIVDKKDPEEFCRQNHVDIRKFNKYMLWFYNRALYHQGLAPKAPMMKSGAGKIKVNPLPVSPVVVSIAHKIKKTLIGCDQQYEEFVDVMQVADKAIMLAGSHGLGKSAMVEDVAEHMGAKVTRIQVTPFTSEVDLIGSTDPNTGKFVEGAVVRAVQESVQNPSVPHFLFFDEFTRGTDEAMTAIYPLIAEKKLIINNPHSDVKEIKVGDNLIVVGTGNVEDKGLRNLGGAEFDRWRVISFKPITDISLLRKICMKHDVLFDESAFSKITELYALSLQYAQEKKIMPMSIRTLVSTLRLAKAKAKRGVDSVRALRSALDNDYFGSSQAFYNPVYLNAYNTIMREVGL